MKAYEDMDYFEPVEKIKDILIKKTQSNSPLFFRVLISYYFTVIASMMRCNINTPDRGEIPVSMYALNLANSGFGKGFSTNIIEEQVINEFKEKFLNYTFETVANSNLDKLALKRANKYNISLEDAKEKVDKEFELQGNLVFSFDSGTTAAVKQMRHKLLMADAGAVNLIIDEIGSNLLSNIEVLNIFLELYDVGKIKQKLIKNTVDNKRSEEIDGRTPTNMLLFGTPAKLLNGGKVEDELYCMLETGFARRCFFGYHKSIDKIHNVSPEKIYEMMTDTTTNDYIKKLSIKLGNRANPINFNKTLTISKDVSLLLIEYKLECEKEADKLAEHEEMKKAEISHRYYKALKLAGTYAFIDDASEITEEYLYNAIKLAEDSGKAFNDILTRDRHYVKLAKYIAGVPYDISQVDLIEDLPFYKGSESQKRDLMNLAIAYGYKNNIIIKKKFEGGIEFLRGESMEITDMHKLTISYSTDYTYNYINDVAKFDELHKLVTLEGYHYAAHHFIDGYRNSTNLISGFNLVILDVDSGISLDTAKLLLKEYKALFATTKRHTEMHNRFRVIMPLSHTVKLNASQYTKFMKNIFNWLPFSVDEQTANVSRKWESFNGDYYYNDGELIDAMLFIPDTRKEEEQKKLIMDTSKLDNLERWFYLNTDMGNRSNQLIKYALVLVDNGYDLNGVKNSVLAFNEKLKEPLEEAEIHSTILISAAKAIAKRDI